MAVYFERPYRPWWSDLASATLSGLVKGMFDRDAAARAQRVNANRWGEFEKLYDEANGQYAVPQESPLAIQSAPETKKLSQTFAPQQNAFGSDPFGGVPEQFRPQEGDGLLGTTVKALQNNAARGFMPTIDDVYKWGAQSGAITDPNFQKFIEARFGSRFKMQDADRLAGRLGNMPQFNDRQGTLNYVGNRALYDPDGAKTVGNFIQHLNPGFNNQAVNLGNRQVVLSQDKYTGETTPVFGGAVGVSPDSLEATKRSYINKDTEALRWRSGWETGNLTSAQYKAIDDARSMVARMSPEDLASLRNNPDQWANVAAMFGLPVEQMGQIIQSPFGYNTSYTNVNNDDTFGSLAPVYKIQGEVINRQGAQTLTPEETYAPSAGDIDELNKMSQEDQKKYMFLMQKTGKSLDEVREAEKNYKQQQKLKQLQQQQQNLHSGT